MAQDNQPLDDEALLAEYVRNRGRARAIVVTVLVAGLVAGVGLGFWATWSDFTGLLNGITIMAFASCGLALILMQFSRRTSAKSIRLARLNSERIHTLRSRTLVFMAVILTLLSASMTVMMILRLGYGGPEIGWFQTLALLFFCVWALVMLLGRNLPPLLRSAVDDELTALNRSRAIRSGFFAFLTGAAALFAAAQISPQWALTGAPGLLTAPLVIAIVHLVWLERNANANG